MTVVVYICSEFIHVHVCLMNWLEIVKYTTVY